MYCYLNEKYAVNSCRDSLAELDISEDDSLMIRTGVYFAVNARRVGRNAAAYILSMYLWLS